MPARHIALSPEAAAVYDAISGTKGAKGAWASEALVAAAGLPTAAERLAAIESRLAAIEAALRRP
jgi:hypothetical protein